MGGADWDLGQRLIERGVCSLDQVREVLSVQERLRRMGAQSKPFARVLLEKGFATREQLLGAGVAAEQLPPKIEERRPAAAPAMKRAWPLPLGIALAAGIAGLVLYGRGVFAPAPPAAPAPPVVTEAEAEALLKAELDKVAAAAASSPDCSNAAEIVRRYETLMKAQAGLKGEIETHRRLKEYREKVEGFARPELKALRQREAALLAENRFAELAALFAAFPARYLDVSEAGRAAREAAAGYKARGLEAWKQGRAEVEKLLEAGRPEDAQVRAAALEAAAGPEQREEAAGLLSRAQREGREAFLKVREELDDLYARKIEGPFREAMTLRDGRRALRLVWDFLAAPWKDAQKPHVFARGVDYEALKAAVAAGDGERVVLLCEAGIPQAEDAATLGPAESALLDLRNAAHMAVFMRDFQASYQEALAGGRALELPTLGKGRFEKRQDRSVFVRANGDVLEPGEHPLREPDLVALALRRDGEEALKQARAGFFYFYSAPLLPELAYEHLARAQQLGARGVRVYLGSLAARAQEQRARQLRTKYGAAQDLFKARQGAQAKRLLGELLEEAGHPFVEAMRPEIEKTLFEIAEGGERERRLAVAYKGAVTALDATTLRVLYDFETRDQSDAFEVITEEGGRTFKGRWRIERGAMESSIEASVLRWKSPVKGDVVLEYDLTPLEDPQNIVVDLYYRRGQTNHYAVVLGFDWVGKPEGDLSNTAEDRYGMPRTALIKYPVQVDKSRWRLEQPWEQWKSRLAGKGFGDWAPGKGKTSRMKIERRGKGLRLLAEGRLAWEGEDDAYSEGGILFYSDCRCRIDNLAISFVAP